MSDDKDNEDEKKDKLNLLEGIFSKPVFEDEEIIEKDDLMEAILEIIQTRCLDWDIYDVIGVLDMTKFAIQMHLHEYNNRRE